MARGADARSTAYRGGTGLVPAAVCAARPYLLITERRARALDLDGAGPTGLALGDLHDAAAILLAGGGCAKCTRQLDVVPVGGTASAAIELAKLAQQLPALLVAMARVRRCAGVIRRWSSWPPTRWRSSGERRSNR
jgi:hypothetical protein